MKEELKCKLPIWYKSIDRDKYYLVLSNDFDSYFSCKLLNRLFRLNIGGYFDLSKGLYLNRELVSGKAPIYIDLSEINGMCFDNHYTFIPNRKRVSPNNYRTDYQHRYNGSTFAFLVALFGVDLRRWNIQQLDALIAIDGWDAGFYKYNGKFRNTTIKWMKLLEVDKYLLPILQEHDSQYFYNFIDQYHLNAKIEMRGNRLYCDQNIKLPSCQFELVKKTTREFMPSYKLQEIYASEPDSIITAAETYKDRYSICRKVK